jgi:hypothetical protein
VFRAHREPIERARKTRAMASRPLSPDEAKSVLGADESPPDTEAAPEELPQGVEPWNGAEMPEGTASSHDLHTLVRDGDDAGAFSSAAVADGAAALAEANHRRLYETRFRDLELGRREDLARHVAGNELFALCMDPAPQVLGALLDNAHFGLDHARVLAQQHKTPQGLEILARRAQFLRDSHVQRRLLQNLQTPENVLERILRMRRLIDVYRSSIDRDLPERTRTRIRARLRPCFMHAEPEERAALIIKTEGRCLMQLNGCTFDGRTTQILCNQTFLSTLFIQNLARFPATPAALLIKLLRSAPVQRQPQLRALLVRHPNTSSEWKRKG